MGLLVWSVLATTSFATDQHWTGLTSTAWGLGTNWNGLAAPGSTDNAVFDGTFSNQPNVGSNTTVGGIWMTTGVGQNVTISGSNTLTLAGNTINSTSGLGILVDNTSAFTLTISANLTLQNAQTWRNNSNNAFTVSGGVNTGNKALTIDGSGNTTISGAITNNGPITKAGSGTLTLSGTGANTDSGAFTVNDGTVQFNKTAGTNAINGSLTVGDGTGAANSAVTRWLAATQISGSNAITINSDGLLDLNNLSDTIGTLSMTGGNVTTGSGTLTLGGTVTGNASSSSANISGNLALGNNRTFTIADGAAFQDMIISAAISGAFTVTSNGAGVLVFSGANTYTGTTSVSAGILNIQNATGLGTTGSGTTVSSGATLQLQGGITIGSEALTISGTGAAGQNGALVNVGGTNNYGGLLTLAADATISSDAGTLNLTNTGTIVGGNHALTLTGSGNGSISSTISTTTTSLTKSGSGTWTLSGPNAYTGTTTVNGGDLSTGTFTLTPTGTVTIASGATYTLTGTLNLTPSTTAAQTFISGAGTLRLRNTSSSASSPDIYYDPTGGSAAGYGVTIASNIDVGSGTHFINGLSDRNDYERYGGDLIFSGNLTGSGNLTFTGTPNTGGTNPPYQVAYVLSGNNSSFSGGITLTDGANLILNNANALTSANSVTFTPGTGAVSGLYLYGRSVTIGALSGTSAGTMNIRNGSLVTDTNSPVNAGIVRSNSILTIQQDTNTTFNGVISDGPNDHGTGDSGTYYTLALVKSGTGTLTLGGVNTYTGGTTINGGALAINSSSSLGSVSGGLTINAGTLEVVTGFSTGRSITLGNTASTFQIDPSQTYTVTSAVGGTGALNKTGTGTLTLQGASTYSGASIINNGTLSLDSAGSTTARLTNTTGITLNSGGTLLLSNSTGTASNDRINNSATMTLNGGTFNTGGFSEHGASNNTAGIGALTLQTTSIIDMGSSASIVAFANSHLSSWSGTLKIYNWSGTPLTGGGTDELFFGNDTTGLTAGQLAEIQFYSGNGTGAYGAGALILATGEVVPVPEPSTWIAGTLAVVGLGFHQRRRLWRLLDIR